MQAVSCFHSRRRLCRAICVNGAVQVRELCVDCGANVRGAGVSVPHHEVRDLESLPLIEDRRPRGDQPSLFE